MSWQCFEWPFCPGVFIAVLAFLTAAVAFKERPSVRWKQGWTTMFLILMVAELAVINRDRKEQNQQQEALLRKATEAVNRSVQAVNAITGDDSFSLVDFTPVKDALTITNHGEYALTAVHMALSIDKEPQRTFDFPTLTPHLQRALLTHNFPVGDHDVNIAFNAVNGNWYETLQTTVINGKMVSALRIIKINLTFANPDRLESVQPLQIWCRVDQDYPLVNGVVDWREHMYNAYNQPVKVPTAPCNNH